jgi:hypothetical protein
MVPLLWGLLLFAGGVLTWRALPHGADSPTAWRDPAGSATTASVVASMSSGIEEMGTRSPALLRMEWPAQRGATGYRIHFQVDDQAIANPLTSPTPIFLYDLDSNPLALPDRFDWAVTAVFPDGHEVISPWQRHAAY